jgi:hypothetical protein
VTRSRDTDVIFRPKNSAKAGCKYAASLTSDLLMKSARPKCKGRELAARALDIQAAVAMVAAKAGTIRLSVSSAAEYGSRASLALAREDN